jgi:hypothetical protein
MMDLEFHEYQKVAEKQWPDLIPTILSSREKIHSAARLLMEDFISARLGLSSESQIQLNSSGLIKMFDDFYSRSKLSSNSFARGLQKVDDESQFLIRADSQFPLHLGFRSQGIWGKMIRSVPFYTHIRDSVLKLELKLSTENQKYQKELLKGVDEFFSQLKVDPTASKPETHLSLAKLVRLLPVDMQEMAKEKAQKFIEELPIVLTLLKNRIFTSRYFYKSARDEMERNFVDYMLHSYGQASNKESISFSTSLSLYSGSLQDGQIAFVSDRLEGRLYLVKIPRNQIHANFGTSKFTSEYEILSDKSVSANAIVSSYKIKDLLPYVTNPSDEVRKFFKDYFEANIDLKTGSSSSKAQ